MSEFGQNSPVSIVGDALVNGYQVILSPALVDKIQVRFPRSKRRRIQKKWAARPENSKTIPAQGALHLKEERILVMHPVVWALLVPKLKDMGVTLPEVRRI